MQWLTQAGIITSDMNVKRYFTSPELSMTKIMMWNFHVDNSATGRYDMILGRYLLTALVLNLKFSWSLIEAGGGTLKEYTAPLVDLGMYEFKYLNTGNITPEEYVTNAYAE